MDSKMYKSEDGAALRFFYGTAKNEFQSSEQGRPVYDKTLNVEVIMPGDVKSMPIFELTRWISQAEGEPRQRINAPYHAKYRRQIEAFVSDNDDPDLLGTPLDAWPALDVAQIAALKEARIYTVEALAGLPDGRLGVLGMGGRALVGRAKAFLDAAQGGAAVEALSARVAVLEAENERLQALVDKGGEATAPVETGPGVTLTPASGSAAPAKTTKRTV